MRRRVRAALFSLAVSIGFSHTQAATIAAKSASLADVTSAVISAKDGDTVTVPAGTATWLTPLTIVNNITLQGAGEALTVIVDAISHREGEGSGESDTERPTSGESSLPGKAQEVRKANGGKMRNPAAAHGHKRVASLIFVNLQRNLPFRLSGFTFRGGGKDRGSFNGEVRVAGNSHSFRIDHCTFDQLPGLSLGISGFLWGVIDHCRFNLDGRQPMHISHESWNGKDHGNGSWADDPFWGSEKFVFVEDNVFENRGKKRAIDAYEGARFVVRHNQFHNCGLTVHGTEGQGRGAKQVEEYNNVYRYDYPAPAGQIRSGCLVSHDNKWTRTVAKGHVLEAYRPFSYSPHWGWANGRNPYDDNILNATTRYWETGKHTGPEGTTVLTDSAKHWTTNQWYEPGAIYIVRNISLEAAAASDRDKLQSFAVSNTLNTITCSPLTHQATQMSFKKGDTYQIWKIAHALDQPGLGKGDLLVGLPGRPAKWPNEGTEPCYSWNNSTLENGTTKDLSSTEPSIKEGRDFFNNTIKPEYKPYTYPHPLVIGTLPERLSTN